VDTGEQATVKDRKSTMSTRHRTIVWRAALGATLLLGAASAARAQDRDPVPPAPPSGASAPAAPARVTAAPAPPSLEIYGFAQADAIVDFKVTNPQWYDVARPSRLPSFDGQYGQNGHFYLSGRQSRFGVKADLPTSNGNVKAVFEFDMFGVGGDAGQTTIRLRHAYGQWKQFGAGQTNSQFMDGDVFPNTLDYWGPSGMLFFRNVQVFWEPYNKGNSNVRIAVENPGASGDAGLLSDRIELQHVQARFPAPDFTGHYRAGAKWGYFQIGGAVRYLAYDDNLDDEFKLSGHVWGWGFATSSNLNLGKKDVVRLMMVYGQGVENYFNDAPVDVGVRTNGDSVITRIAGKALPDLGIVAYLDHNWNKKWSTAAGYSRVQITNSNLQANDAFKTGQYASFNLLCAPVQGVMMGGEFQWVRRDNFRGAFTSNDMRLQFSFKYSFSHKVGG